MKWEDEVEEAARSDELAEGRLKNRGRAEMVRAINFMSRAEAQLNDGRAEEALPLERQALASLERGPSTRRRYFLRTLARSSIAHRHHAAIAPPTGAKRVRGCATAPPIPCPRRSNRQREVMRELVSAAAGTSSVDASLAARVAAIDPASPELQKAAVGIADRSAASTSGAVRFEPRCRRSPHTR